MLCFVQTGSLVEEGLEYISSNIHEPLLLNIMNEITTVWSGLTSSHEHHKQREISYSSPVL